MSGKYAALIISNVALITLLAVSTLTIQKQRRKINDLTSDFYSLNESFDSLHRSYCGMNEASISFQNSLNVLSNSAYGKDVTVVQSIDPSCKK